MTFVSVCMLQRSVTHDPFIPCHMSFLCLVAYYEANVILSSLIPCLKFFFYFNVFFHAAKLNFLKWNLDSINPVLQFSWALPSATLIVSHSTWHSALLPGHVSQSMRTVLSSEINTKHLPLFCIAASSALRGSILYFKRYLLLHQSLLKYPPNGPAQMLHCLESPPSSSRLPLLCSILPLRPLVLAQCHMRSIMCNSFVIHLKNYTLIYVICRHMILRKAFGDVWLPFNSIFSLSSQNSIIQGLAH